MKTTQWFRLDNVAKVFPVLAENKQKNYFRLVFELKDKIDPIQLQIALEKTIKRFPTFQVRLRRGLFWFYFERFESTPHVIPETNYLGQLDDIFFQHQFLFYVLYHESRIALEVFHSLTDGKGGLEFLKTLVFQYLLEIGHSLSNDSVIINPQDEVNAEETSDGFQTYFQDKTPRKFAKVHKAYHVQGTRFDFGGHHLLHAHFPLNDLLIYCREKQTTLTILLAAIIIESLAKDQQKKFFLIRKPIIIMVPIDLRKYFQSKTVRNFLSYAFVGGVITPSMKLEDIIAMVDKQLKEGTKIEALKPQIASTLIIEKNPWIRLLPLFIKNWITKLAYGFLGDPSYSFIFSNLGKIEVPEPMRSFIHHAEFILSSSKLIPITLGLCSFENNLVLSFSRIIHQREITQTIVERLQDLTQIKAVMNGNLWEEV
jgi:NRPS condensation-like uncharacterized protein